MTTAKERVEEELEFLCGQLAKLEACIKNNRQPAHSHILSIQAGSMRSYKAILEYRLANWEEQLSLDV